MATAQKIPVSDRYHYDAISSTPLQTQIEALNRASVDPIVYTAEWLEQIAAIGAYAYALSAEDGGPSFAVGFPYDAEWPGRRERVDALCGHLQRSGHRDLVAAFLS